MWRDEQSRLALARDFVEAKIMNGRAVLRRRLRRSGDPASGLGGRLRHWARRAQSAGSVDTLMGIEGSAAKDYFAGFEASLVQDLGFRGRRKRPPPDPVNGLLSFGYTLLFGQVLSGILSQGLDPYLGHLHAIKKNRPSLALDMMEEMRPVVDALVLSVVNKFQMTARHFDKTKEKGVRMTPRGMQIFVSAFHKAMAREVTHRPTGRKLTYTEYCRQQAKSYRSSLRGEGEYVPLAWR